MFSFSIWSSFGQHLYELSEIEMLLLRGSTKKNQSEIDLCIKNSVRNRIINVTGPTKSVRENLKNYIWKIIQRCT